MAAADRTNILITIISLLSVPKNVFSMPGYRISHPRNMINYVSMAYDVWASKMAVKMAATNMENIEMAITSVFNSICDALFVYLQVLSYKE